jgi:glycosyltransferase involved in cell wall biosynthesis
MKVIYVNVEDEFFLGQRLNLALAAKEQGHDVTIASNKSDRHTDILGYGFKYIDTGNSRLGKNPFQQIAAIFRLYSIFKNLKPDIVHNISVKPVIYGSIAAKLSGVPMIVNLINGLGYAYVEDASIKRKFVKHIVTLLYRIALMGQNVRVIFQNPDDRRLFIKKQVVSTENSYTILGSGVDTEYFCPGEDIKPNSAPVILYFGRMLWDKGLRYLVEASQLLKSKSIEFDLVLAGEPDASNPASIDEQILRKWEAANLITYLGYRSDILGLIRGADIIVLPSYYREGVPLSLIEAASVGKAIVTTDTPGCREIVIDGHNGFLVPPKDSQFLADKLLTLIESRELREKFGEKSRQRAVDVFSKEIVNKATLSIYVEE